MLFVPRFITLMCALTSYNYVSSLYCYWNTGCPYKLFSSITPYTVVRGDMRDSALKIRDCEPISIWSISRNGKTHPDQSTGKKMNDAIRFKENISMSINSSLCAQDKENIQGSVDNEMLTKFSYLSSEGYQELLGIGRRLKEAFPDLLSMLDNNTYEFISANSHSVHDSAKAFVFGLTEGKELTITEDDSVTMPYQECKRYINEVFLNRQTYDEVTKFMLKSTDYQVAKDRIQRRSGFSFILTNQDIQNLYDLCRYFWSGISNKQSPWCALFTSEDLKVLEYNDDLIHYYRNGYGNPMHHQLAKPALNGLLTSFQLAKEGRGKKVVSYFTHVTMMDMIYSALGIFKDNSPLNGLNRVPARKWRSSYHSSFSSNLMAVLNRCKSNGKTEYSVVFYLNEKLLTLLCDDGICTWEEFVTMMKPFSNATLDVC